LNGAKKKEPKTRENQDQKVTDRDTELESRERCPPQEKPRFPLDNTEEGEKPEKEQLKKRQPAWIFWKPWRW